MFRIVKIKITIVTLFSSYTTLATLKLDIHSSVQTLIDFTRTLLTFRFVIASTRSMVFECLDNFLFLFFEFGDQNIMKTLIVILEWAYREQCVHL